MKQQTTINLEIVPTILYRHNIFESKADVIVNPVNCVGAMGAGLALSFANKFPDMLADYKDKCKHGLVKIGEPYIFTSPNRKILLFPTKDDWKNPSKIEYIYDGISYLAKNYREMGIKSIAIPALGCGKGQLSWAEVQPIIFFGCLQMGIKTFIYAPISAEPTGL